MNKWPVLACCWLAACVSGPKIYMTNEAGDRIDCGSLQTAAVQSGEYLAAAAIANNGVRGCVERHQATGYEVEVPRRAIKAVAYAAAGPLHDKGYTGAIQGLIVAQGTKGKFVMQRPDGVSCEGSFATMQGQGENALIVKYRDVVGINLSVDGMIPGMALGSCTNGVQFQAEYYVVRGTDNGFGVGVDGDGNIFKIISQ